MSVQMEISRENGVPEDPGNTWGSENIFYLASKNQ